MCNKRNSAAPCRMGAALTYAGATRCSPWLESQQRTISMRRTLGRAATPMRNPVSIFEPPTKLATDEPSSRPGGRQSEGQGDRASEDCAGHGTVSEALSDRLVAELSSSSNLRTRPLTQSTRTFQPRIPLLRSTRTSSRPASEKGLRRSRQTAPIQVAFELWRRSHSTVLCEGSEL